MARWTCCGIGGGGSVAGGPEARRREDLRRAALRRAALRLVRRRQGSSRRVLCGRTVRLAVGWRLAGGSVGWRQLGGRHGGEAGWQAGPWAGSGPKSSRGLAVGAVERWATSDLRGGGDCLFLGRRSAGGRRAQGERLAAERAARRHRRPTAGILRTERHKMPLLESRFSCAAVLGSSGKTAPPAPGLQPRKAGGL